MALDTKTVREFAQLQREKDKLKKKLAKIEADMKALKPQLLDAFMENEVQSVPIKFGNEKRTVYVKSIVRAAVNKEGLSDDEAKDRLAKALKRAKLGYLVKEGVNMNSLSSVVCERLAEGKKLPPSLADAIDVNETIDLVVTKTTKTETTSQRASKTLNKQRGQKVANA